MMAFRKKGGTMVFCSHSLYHIREVCDICLWLKNGRVEMLGPTAEITEAYQDYIRSRDGQAALPADLPPALPEKAFSDSHLLEVILEGDLKDGVIGTGGKMTVRVKAVLSPAAEAEGAHLGILFVRNDNIWCYGVGTKMNDAVLYPLGKGQYGISLLLDELPLLAGQYSLEVVLFDGTAMHAYDHWKGVGCFRVTQSTQEVGMVRLEHHWEPL